MSPWQGPWQRLTTWELLWTYFPPSKEFWTMMSENENKKHGMG